LDETRRNSFSLYPTRKNRRMGKNTQNLEGEKRNEFGPRDQGEKERKERHVNQEKLRTDFMQHWTIGGNEGKPAGGLVQR